MMRFVEGIVTPSYVTVQASNAVEMAVAADAALAAIPAGSVVTALGISGAGAGSVFSLSIEHAAVEGGIPSADARLGVRFFHGANRPALDAAAAAARASAAAANPTFVSVGMDMAGSSAGGSFMGVLLYAPPPAGSELYQSQSVWYIDPLNGNDANDGLTALTALRTDAERQRRVGLVWDINADTSIYYLNDVPTGDPVYGIVRFGPNGVLRVRGTATVTYTSPGGGFSAVTNLNRAAQTPADITEAGLGAGRAGQRIRATSGLSVGALAWLAKDLGAGQYRVSPWTRYNDGATPLPSTPTNHNVAPGDTFVIESLTEIVRMQWTVLASDKSVQVNGVQILFRDIEIQDSSRDIIQYNAPNAVFFSPVAFGCNWNGCPFNGTSIACAFDPTTFVGTLAGMYSCYVQGSVSVQTDGMLYVDFDTLFQGGTFGYNLRLRQGGQARMGAAAFFDSTADGVVVEDGSVRSLAFLSGNDLIWGTSNAAYGIRVRAGHQWLYGTMPILTGTTNDTIIGGTATAYAGIPFIEPANNAAMVAFA